MPVSDYLLSLVLAMHPAGGHQAAITLGADALGQPDGGASLVRVADVSIQHKATTDAGSRDPVKPQFVIKGNVHARAKVAFPGGDGSAKDAALTKHVKHHTATVRKTEGKTLEGYVTPGRKY